MIANKIYFKFVNSEEYWYHWVGQNWDILRFPGQPKFIVQALVKKFWREKWQQVFQDFMAGMEELENLDAPSHWKNPPAGFVLYLKNRDVNKDSRWIYKKEIHDTE